MQTPSRKDYYLIHREEILSYNRQWKLENREYVRLKAKEYRQKNKEKLADYQKSYSESHPGLRKVLTKKWKQENPERYRYLTNSGKLKWKYGITTKERDEMFVKQGSKCKICGILAPRGKRPWHIDHDHSTGKVRGILCHCCNLMLGGAKDNIETLRSAISYLKESPQ